MSHTANNHVHIYIAPIPANPFEESVYDMIPIAVPAHQKPKQYVSKYRNQVKHEYVSTFKHKPGLAKRCGTGTKSAGTSFAYPERRKDPLPKSCGVLKPANSTDFIKSNRAKAASLVLPTIPPTTMYKDQPKFGNVPKYLCKLDLPAPELPAPNGDESSKLVRIPDSERKAIQAGLQLNWDKLNSEYQKLSLTVDTVPKIVRKVNMEQQLKRIEEDIQRFSHENIYVCFES